MRTRGILVLALVRCVAFGRESRRRSSGERNVMKRLMRILGTMMLLASSLVPAAISEPVRLDTGLLSGTSGTGDGVRVFKGIPFAAPPVGALRWRAPQQPAAWDGVRNGEAFGPRCMQSGGGRGGQPVSEDCLHLNVWAGADAASERAR